MIVDYTDYLSAGWHIFPLHAIEKDMSCACDNPHCEAVGKHPIMSGWQHIQKLDDDQLDFYEGGLCGGNMFNNGFGLNLTHLPLLIVDVDARNGGVESLNELNHTLGLDLCECAGFVVETGSGGGSKHIYFSVNEVDGSLLTNLPLFRGIDFKSSGFVVGCSSNHISGDMYRAIKGGPHLVAEAPPALIKLLQRKPKLQLSSVSSAAIDDDELSKVVMTIPNCERDYEKWLRVGMGIHNATQGSDGGLALWEKWSSQCDAHDSESMSYKWHSFGKYPSDNVTVGTLMLWAKENGYVEPVTFENKDSNLDFDDDDVDIDLLRPRGLVGELVDWINSRCMYPRASLAVMAALTIVSNCAGLRYRVDGFNTTLNLISFGIASSGSGKGAILASMQEAMRTVGINAAVYGGIKSEQEMYRNLLRHQASCYLIDEVGSLLSKIGNSSKSKASYLEGVVATTISVFSAANGYVAVNGDTKEKLHETLAIEMARLIKRTDAGEQGLEGKIEELKKQMSSINDGIENPYLSLCGVAEPGRFYEAINADEWLITGGLVGRALIFTEDNDVPHRKAVGEFGDHPLPHSLASQLRALYYGGTFDADDCRVRRMGELVSIPLDDEAKAYEDKVYKYWNARGIKEQEQGTGMQTLTMRATELTLKLAGCIGVGMGGVITLYCMRYADYFVRRITNEKITRAKAIRGSSSKDIDEKSQGVLNAIVSVLGGGGEHTLGAIANKFYRKYERKQIEEGLGWLVNQSKIKCDVRKDGRGKVTNYYRVG